MADRRLPILVPNLPQQRFRCHGCTNCCRDIVVHLTSDDRRKIDEQGWADRLDVPPYVRLGRGWVLSQTTDNRCIFLMPDGKCRIHAEFSASAKPLGCQLFPFVLLPAGGAWQLSTRFDCPSVAASKGDPITTHLPELKRLAAELPGTDHRAWAIKIRKGRPASESEVQHLVAALDRRLSGATHSLSRRLRELRHVADMLASLNIQRVREERFVQLVDLLFGALDSEVADSAHPPPTPRQHKLLRQQVFTHCQAITVTEALGGWRVKTARMISQFFRSRRFTALGGAAPPSIVTAKIIPFADIDSVLPAKRQAAGVEELVIRYLRGQVLSRSFFGPQFYGWDIVTGLRALLSRMAVWGFLARYCAAAEGKTEIDLDCAIRAVGIIARAAGISKALGGRTERMRLSYLQSNHGFERLLHAYPLACGGDLAAETAEIAEKS